MCGRGSLTVDADELREVFDLDDLPPASQLSPRYNIAPSQPVAVIRIPHKLELIHWGLGGQKGGGINVRVESVARAPAYRASFARRRCLVVMDGFYEWRKDGKVRKPFAVRRTDGKPFALAGIWEPRVTADGEVIDSAAIITGPAKGVVAALHDRMPVIVSASGYAPWISPETKFDDLRPFLHTDATDLVSFPVSTFVNSAANDGPQCLEPIEHG